MGPLLDFTKDRLQQISCMLWPIIMQKKEYCEGCDHYMKEAKESRFKEVNFSSTTFYCFSAIIEWFDSAILRELKFCVHFTHEYV